MDIPSTDSSVYIPPAKTTSYSLPSSWVDIVTASRFLGKATYDGMLCVNIEKSTLVCSRMQQQGNIWARRVPDPAGAKGPEADVRDPTSWFWCEDELLCACSYDLLISVYRYHLGRRVVELIMRGKWNPILLPHCNVAKRNGKAIM